jgi:hypothetical protein
VYGLCCRDGAACEKKPAGRSISFGLPTDEVPKRRVTLPFIEEDRAGDAADQAPRVGCHDFEPGRIVELEDLTGASTCRLGLAYGPRSFQDDGRQARHQLIQLAVDDARKVVHGPYTTVCQEYTLPFARHLRYRLPGIRPGLDASVVADGFRAASGTWSDCLISSMESRRFP